MLLSASRGRRRHTAGGKGLCLTGTLGMVSSFSAAQLIHSGEPSAQVIQNVGVREHGGPPASAVATNQSTQSPFELCRPDSGPVTASAPSGHQALGTCASQGLPNTPWHLPLRPVPWQWPPVLQHLRGAGTSPHLWSVQFSCSVMSDSLRPHEPQHARPLCPSPTPRVHPNSCPSSWWCHPTISYSVVPFSSRPQSFPASGSFQMSQLFASVTEVLEFQLQHQSFQWKFRADLL